MLTLIIAMVLDSRYMKPIDPALATDN